MALSYIYKDSYLQNLVTQQNEDDAVTSIATYGTFTDTQLEMLVPIRAYILCCIDNVKAGDDIFAVKKKFYEQELKTAIEAFKAQSATTSQASLFSIPIERA